VVNSYNRPYEGNAPPRRRLLHEPVFALAHPAPAVEDELLPGLGEFLQVLVALVAVVGVVDALVLLE
jgi:hypothetical protein